MITILSQDKTEIIKCNDVYQIRNAVVEDFNNKDNTVATLGTYATEERAKEVVAEIWELIRKNSKYKIETGSLYVENVIPVYNTFEMPIE